MLKRHNNTIYKLFFRSKTIKVMLSSITKIKLIIYIEDPKEAFNIDHIHIKKDTVVKKTTIVDTVTTNHPIKNNAISVINLDTSQTSIQ